MPAIGNRKYTKDVSPYLEYPPGFYDDVPRAIKYYQPVSISNSEAAGFGIALRVDRGLWEIIVR